MKSLLSKFSGKIQMFIAAMMLTLVSVAQDTKKIDVDIDTKSNDSGFFMQPWVWVVGGAVFILLLIALLRGNSNK